MRPTGCGLDIAGVADYRQWSVYSSAPLFTRTFRTDCNKSGTTMQFSVNAFTPYCFHNVVVSLPYSYFHRLKHLHDFVIDKYASLISRVSVKRSHWKTFFKWDAEQKSLRNPALGRVAGGSSPWRTWNTSRSTVISSSFAGSTQRRDQARPEM